MGALKQLAEQAGQVPSAEPKAAPLTFPVAMRTLFEGAREQILATLPDRIDTDRFIMVSLTAITRNEKLIDCTPASIFLAVMESARIGLFPDNREAAIIPYKGRAELQPMVQGITRLMLRSPGLLKVEARVVYDGDDFEFQYGLTPVLRHVPRELSDKLTHAYAVLWRQGTDPTFEVVGWEEIERARLTSRAPDSPAWKSWYGEMARKVAVKRLSKYADLSPEASRAIELDNLVSGSPWAGREPEGVAPEYASQLVRSQTVAGIDRLKERIGAAAKGVAEAAMAGEVQVPPAAESGEAEAPTEPTEAAAGEAGPEPARSSEERTFTPVLLDEIVAAKLAPNRSEAAIMLGLSPWADKSVSIANRKAVLHWAKAYAGYQKDEGYDDETAARAATEFLGPMAPKAKGD